VSPRIIGACGSRRIMNIMKLTLYSKLIAPDEAIEPLAVLFKKENSY
jgi:hypothetical protein